MTDKNKKSVLIQLLNLIFVESKKNTTIIWNVIFIFFFDVSSLLLCF